MRTIQDIEAEIAKVTKDRERWQEKARQADSAIGKLLFARLRLQLKAAIGQQFRVPSGMIEQLDGAVGTLESVGREKAVVDFGMWGRYRLCIYDIEPAASEQGLFVPVAV